MDSSQDEPSLHQNQRPQKHQLTHRYQNGGHIHGMDEQPEVIPGNHMFRAESIPRHVMDSPSLHARAQARGEGQGIREVDKSSVAGAGLEHCVRNVTDASNSPMASPASVRLHAKSPSSGRSSTSANTGSSSARVRLAEENRARLQALNRERFRYI
ncbi:uncharacterized protein LOC117115723 isoform X1 [Anneissia japonica]|uniref:uncharacterized protein LOC117115723 isoform X1 n=1 Tax=Anneissia japonica TaxID=1529436 RepID=UPI001425A624|nr:uncharacterized protein LOC117115723 isoform X1 [Anneissia japonica]XP_033115535.1 uncharacterized protein LOC117115723 isoform X1 [Anneissia japonica]XP_033115536.1 uncharacterized protein LOC117115723 isoform X1 [Anneissia japonica]